MSQGMQDGLWTEVEPSQFSHEREALDFVRRRLPDREPWRAWSNFTFIDGNGRAAEVDLLVVAPRGIVLIEVKSFPNGELSGDARTWRWQQQGRSYQRSYDNPFYAADSKAKRLRGLLEVQRALRGSNAPRSAKRLWVDSLVFLSSPHLKVTLSSRGRTAVYGPDPQAGKEQANRLPGLIAYLSGLDAQRGAQIDRPLSAAIARAMDQADIRQSEAYRRAGSYELVKLLDEGETWQDYRAAHRFSRVDKRARIHLRGRAADDTERQAIDRAAEREFRLLSRLQHPGIESPEGLEPNPRGLVTLYAYDPGAVRLDHWVDTHPDADLYTRLTLVRAIAETVAHAHEHGLSHRTLTPRHVWLTDADGTPTPRLRDWATVGRDLGSTATSTPARNGSRHPEHLVRLAGADAGPYLAPELRTVPDASGRLADVFALGTLTHLLITGRPPAADGDALLQLLDEHGNVPLAAAIDAPPTVLVDLVAGATAFDVSERFPSVSEFLAWLDMAEDELTAPDDVDLLSASQGTRAGEWTVTHRLGAGATSVVLRAERDGVAEVLKVARNDDYAELLRGEYEALRQLRHTAIIAAHGLERIGNHTVLRLQSGLVRQQGDAGVADTLAARLRTDGPPTLDLLQRWGNDLLNALVELERMGIDHRDLKPENLVFIEHGRYKETHLALIDFSLSRASKTDLDAGTVGYLDPFLRDRPARQWDLHAERYAAAMVLGELATGERPVWGDGADPRSTDLDVPDVHAEAIDPAIREPLVEVLQRALHRDPARRFDTADDFRRAWDRVFADVDTTSGHARGASADELDLSGLSPTTAIAELGLAPRLVGAIERLGVADVGALARVRGNELTISGVGAAVRRELRHLVRRLRDAGLGEEPEALGDLSPDDLARLSVDRLADRLVPPSNLADAERMMLRILLGLEADADQRWPTATRTAKAMDTEVSTITSELERARRRWAEYRPELRFVRDELAEWLATREGVAAGEELAELLLARRGSRFDEPHRSRHARAVVRACVEAESAITQPRFRGVRIEAQWLVALDRPAAVAGRGTIEWDADALVEAAAALGERAEQLVDDGDVVPPATVLSALRAIEWPALPSGVAFDDVRLVQLAAAASTTAAVSSRGELYVRGLPATTAAKAARLALLSRGGLTEEQVRQRVRARFPQAEELPSRPELDRVLDEAEVGLHWDVDAARFALPDGVSWMTGRTPSWSSTQYESQTEREAEAAELDRRLQRMRSDGGFIAATVDPRRLDRAARTLAARMDAPLLDLDNELITAMRAAAGSAGARWEVLVDADAAPRSDPRFKALERLVNRAITAVDQRVRDAGETVVATGAGLVARYGAMGLVERWRDDLTRSTTIDGMRLRGLVLLVPGTDRDERPKVDGAPIPVVTAGQWARVPTSWLDHAA